MILVLNSIYVKMHGFQEKLVTGALLGKVIPQASSKTALIGGRAASEYPVLLGRFTTCSASTSKFREEPLRAQKNLRAVFQSLTLFIYRSGRGGPE